MSKADSQHQIDLHLVVIRRRHHRPIFKKKMFSRMTSTCRMKVYGSMEHKSFRITQLMFRISRDERIQFNLNFSSAVIK